MPYLRVVILSAAVAGASSGQAPTFRGSLPAGRLTADGVHLPPGVVRVFGDVRFRESVIIDRAYSPDGKWILTTCFDGLRIRDAETGAVVGRFDQPINHESRTRFAADGKTLWVYAVGYDPAAPGGWRREVVRLAVPDGRVLTRAAADPFPKSADRLVCDGKIVGRTADGGLALFDPAAGAVVRRLANSPHTDDRTYAVSADGSRVAFGRRGRLCVLDAATLAEVAVMPAERFYDVAFGAGGALHAVEIDRPRDDNGRPSLLVTKWAIPTATAAGAVRVELPNGTQMDAPLAVSPDGKLIALNQYDHGVVVVDAESGAAKFRILCNGWGPNRVAFRPDGREVAAGGIGLAFYAAATGRRHPRSADLADGGFQSAAGLRFSRDGATLTVLPDAYGAVTDYATASGAATARREWLSAADAGEYAGFAWHGLHGDRAAVGRSADGVYTARVVRQAGTPEVPNRTGHALTLSVGGQEVKRFPEAYPGMHELAFSPGGKYLIGNNWGENVPLYDIAAGTVGLLPIDPDKVNRHGNSRSGPILYPSPDGTRIAVHDVNVYAPDTVGYRYGVSIFDLATRKELGRVRGVGNLMRLAWSPDGTRLAATGNVNWLDYGAHLFLWDAASGKEVVRFPNQEYFVTLLNFSPDGGTLAACDPVHGVRLWEVATGQLRRPLPGACFPFSFSPDGRFLAAAGHKNLVFLWDVSSPPDPAGSLDSAWATLTSDDAPAAFAAVLRLTADPAGVAFLAAKPADEVAAAADIAALVAKLDAPSFAAREAASEALRAHAAAAEPLLKKAVAESPSAEVRERATQLLKLPPLPPTAAQRRAARSVEVLARVGSPAAVKLLQVWAGGDASSRRTIGSRRALAASALRQH